MKLHVRTIRTPNVIEVTWTAWLKDTRKRFHIIHIPVVHICPPRRDNLIIFRVRHLVHNFLLSVKPHHDAQVHLGFIPLLTVVIWLVVQPVLAAPNTQRKYFRQHCLFIERRILVSRSSIALAFCSDPVRWGLLTKSRQDCTYEQCKNWSIECLCDQCSSSLQTSHHLDHWKI